MFFRKQHLGRLKWDLQKRLDMAPPIMKKEPESQKAMQLGQEVASLAAGLEVDPQFGHFPPEKKSNRGKKQMTKQVAIEIYSSKRTDATSKQ